MRGALIHGVLLAVMLVYGYRTWTRDKTVKPDLGSVVLWDKSEKDIVSIAYKNENREVKLEQRTANGETYWWGSDTTITKQPKAVPPKPPEPPKDAGSAAGSGAGAGSGSGSAAKPPTQGSGAAGSAAGSGSAGSGAGSGSATPPEPPKPPEMEEVRKTREFPLGEGGTKIVKNYVAARAIRDLGVPTDAQKKTYKLDAPKSSITITFKDGARTFQLGDAVYGNQDKYALDDKSGHAYVLSKDLLTNLELGEQSLHLADARGFDVKAIESVTIEGAGKSKTGIRTETEVEGRKIKTWADGETKKPHPSLGNFIDQLGSMPPTEYSPKTKIESLTSVVKVTYKDGSGSKLGTLTLYKGEKPPTIAPDQEIDPANPPRGEVEYYIVTEKSRVPAVVRKDTAQQVETNLPVIMNEKPPEPGKSIDPKGNPFGNTPLPTPGATPPDDGHGHGAAPGGHGAPGGGLPPGHGAPTPPPGGGLTPPPSPPTPPAAGSAAKPAPAAGSAAKPAPAAKKPAPAAGSAAKPAPAKPAAAKPAPAAGSAAKPAAAKPAPAAGSAANPG